MSKKIIKDDNVPSRIETLNEAIEKAKQAKLEAQNLWNELSQYGITYILKGSDNPTNMQKLIDRLERAAKGKVKTVPIPFLTGK